MGTLGLRTPGSTIPAVAFSISEALSFGTSAGNKHAHNPFSIGIDFAGQLPRRGGDAWMDPTLLRLTGQRFDSHPTRAVHAAAIAVRSNRFSVQDAPDAP